MAAAQAGDLAPHRPGYPRLVPRSRPWLSDPYERRAARLRRRPAEQALTRRVLWGGPHSAAPCVQQRLRKQEVRGTDGRHLRVLKRDGSGSRDAGTEINVNVSTNLRGVA